MTAAAPSTSRRRLFVAGALLLPVVLFALLEAVLRGVGPGAGDRLFVPDLERPGWLVASRDVMQRYLPTPGEPVTWIDPFPFAAEKPPGGLRLVVQGGSSAAGFPYGRWGSLAGMLSDRLEAANPGGRIEVVSTAIAAVSSYTLLDLADEIVAIEPDAVLVYAGHNEYLGVLGVGSALGGARSPLAARAQLCLARSRVARSLQRGIAGGLGWLRAIDGAAPETLFERAAAGSLIPFDSPTYHAGLAQFEANLGALLDRYRGAGIPVYLGTLVSNDRSMPPFAGGPAPEIDAEAWSAGWRALEAARDGGTPADERAAIEALIALDPNAADAWFALGRLELQEGRNGEARDAFERARDRDALRFRAPSAMNAAVRRLAARPGVTLVDVEARFRAVSPFGVIGRELLLEHVHPNAEGYFLLADAYYEALRADGLLGDWASTPSRAEARRDMPLTRLDRLLARYDVERMVERFPFDAMRRPVDEDPDRDDSDREDPGDASEVERIARAVDEGRLDRPTADQQLFDHYRKIGRPTDAARLARLAAHAAPGDPAPSQAAGLLLLEIEQPARARVYLERSLAAQPDDVRTLAALLRADRALGDEAAAAERAAALARLAPDHPLLAVPAPGS